METLARVFQNIVEAFFGTPRRVQVTAMLMVLGVIYFNPGLAGQVGKLGAASSRNSSHCFRLPSWSVVCT